MKLLQYLAIFLLVLALGMGQAYACIHLAPGEEIRNVRITKGYEINTIVVIYEHWVNGKFAGVYFTVKKTAAAQKGAAICIARSS